MPGRSVGRTVKRVGEDVGREVAVLGQRDALVHVVGRPRVLVQVRGPAHLSLEHVLKALLLQLARKRLLEDGLVHRDGAHARARHRSARRNARRHHQRRRRAEDSSTAVDVGLAHEGLRGARVDAGTRREERVGRGNRGDKERKELH